MTTSQNAEWIETDGLGGFASGTVSGIRTRRYHGLLIPAVAPPASRMMLVNGIEAWIEVGSDRFAISTQHYHPDVVVPDGRSRLALFESEPWPTWTFRIGPSLSVRQEFLLVQDSPQAILWWRIVGTRPKDVVLRVRPLISGRDYHALHHENGSFDSSAVEDAAAVRWRPYTGVPAITASGNGAYRHEPAWFRNFRYDEERRRGLDDTEDLASPGEFSWDLSARDATLVLSADDDLPPASFERATALTDQERRRRAAFARPLERAADQYIVRRGARKTIIAGYPWFTDWGRDTFISMRGLCIAAGRFDVAADILLAWAETVSDGMLPNRFPDRGEGPEYNSVDASLWYVVAVHDFLRRVRSTKLARGAEERLRQAVASILDGYAAGTRFRIRMDDDGLLACGQAGVQLTWMDAKVGDWVVTPRVGKPVEVQALWLNALRIAGADDSKWNARLEKAAASFNARFWNEARGRLFDVVDADHESGKNDGSLRPNQIFAVGGLPFQILSGEPARRVVSVVQAKLLTPVGLRSLAPEEPAYHPHYLGSVHERDGAYHQGTVWPWLMGPFVEAWLRVNGTTPKNRAEARKRFYDPLIAQLGRLGIGHIAEIADADAPHDPRGCPFQAWSLGELLRMEKLLADPEAQVIRTDMSANAR
mgnify:CR=1 FL=1